MRAKEFISESFDSDDFKDGLALAKDTLPQTYVISNLENQDFYKIYRFGLALAAVRGEQGREDGVQNLKYQPDFKATSAWGEHEVVTSSDPDIASVLDNALRKINLSGKRSVSTKRSQESSDIDTTSPIKPFQGYKKK